MTNFRQLEDAAVVGDLGGGTIVGIRVLTMNDARQQRRK